MVVVVRFSCWLRAGWLGARQGHQRSKGIIMIVTAATAAAAAATTMDPRMAMAEIEPTRLRATGEWHGVRGLANE